MKCTVSKSMLKNAVSVVRRVVGTTEGFRLVADKKKGQLSVVASSLHYIDFAVPSKVSTGDRKSVV